MQFTVTYYVYFQTYSYPGKFIIPRFFYLSLGTGKEVEETNLLRHLSDACLVVDALEPSVREELVKNFCNRELISYQQIFEGAGLFLITIYLVLGGVWISLFNLLMSLLKLKGPISSVLMTYELINLGL